MLNLKSCSTLYKCNHLIRQNSPRDNANFQWKNLPNKMINAKIRPFLKDDQNINIYGLQMGAMLILKSEILRSSAFAISA